MQPDSSGAHRLMNTLNTVEKKQDSKQELLSLAHELCEQLDADNETRVDQLLAELTSRRDNSLFCELGKLTRELHETLATLQMNARISNLAEQGIPSAKQDLSYVITMSEQSAHRTLDAVEKNAKICHSMNARVLSLKRTWATITGSFEARSELAHPIQEIATFLTHVDSAVTILQQNLNEILMAQESQDLSGQIIRRVIQLVQDVENHLVNIIRIRGLMQCPTTESTEEAYDRKGAGPSIPGENSAEVVQSQDDVDELLTSLGF